MLLLQLGHTVLLYRFKVLKKLITPGYITSRNGRKLSAIIFLDRMTMAIDTVPFTTALLVGSQAAVKVALAGPGKTETYRI